MAQYDSFLLRIWRSSLPDGSQLSARLQHLQSGECVRYTDSETLIAHLIKLLDAGSEWQPPTQHGLDKHDSR